ncbi:MAG TPA: response regulator [Chloroflexota bacterium]|nr:response regulator [Chloroflexota bacterium]
MGLSTQGVDATVSASRTAKGDKPFEAIQEGISCFDFAHYTQTTHSLLANQAPMARSTKPPVMVVDDDPAILDIVSDILESEGFAVEKATNGAEALREVERIRPAVILLDMRMPVMDGWTFAKELKKRGMHFPILVMTAAQNARRWAEEIGADGYLAKPFDLLDLLQAIGRYYPPAS